jgi:hypothetical protein
MTLSVIFADFDPGTLTGSHAILLAVGIVILLSIIFGLALFLKAARLVGRLLIWLFIGICVTVVLIWLGHKGIIHLL